MRSSVLPKEVAEEVDSIPDNLVYFAINWIMRTWNCHVASNNGKEFPIFVKQIPSCELNEIFDNGCDNGVDRFEAVLLKALNNSTYQVPKEMRNGKKLTDGSFIKGFARVTNDDIHEFEVDFNASLIPYLVGEGAL